MFQKPHAMDKHTKFGLLCPKDASGKLSANTLHAIGIIIMQLHPVSKFR